MKLMKLKDIVQLVDNKYAGKRGELRYLPACL